MSTETKRNLPGTSRQAEEKHLEEVLQVVRENVKKYSQEVSALRTGIDDMLAHFHDDNPELINELENMDTMYSFMKRTLQRNERAQKKPYFGRIDFLDKALGTQESFYIGRSGVSRDATHPVVIDWRAPVANTYYENGLGKCSYLSPDGNRIKIDLKLKRTYEIEDGKLQNVFDTEVVANDDILTRYLSKNKQAVLGEIVATIQKEQNEIIRKTPYHNCLIQGVAGSGKTTVAMHRISYILYNYEERFRPEDFYIVGSNRILLNYITGVLPDLDVYGVRQMTMEQLFIRLLYEDWDEKKYRVKKVHVSEQNAVKGTLAWFRDLEEFCGQLEREKISVKSVYLNRKQFVEGFVDGKSGVHDRSGEGPASPRDMVLLMEGAAVKRYLEQNPTISIQSKIDMLNERLRIRIKDEFLGKGVKYTEAERRAILKAYHGRYGANTWKTSIYELYQEFLLEQREKGYETDWPEDSYDVYDLAALAYLYKRVKETDEISEAHHVVIDEAQDFGMMAYSVLKYCIKDCTYTIMGDVSQNIQFGFGLNDWEELKKLYLKDSRASFGILKKSYRNTVEISDFATNILKHGRFAVYPVEPIIRHGEAPQVRETADEEEMLKHAEEICRSWQKKGLETIAVICTSDKEAKHVAGELGKRISVMENDLETAEFGNGIMVLPVEYTKGLEFDAVLLWNPDRTAYPLDDGHAKLLYVAATRALHELCVLHTGNLTGLIADPVAAQEMELFKDENSVSQDVKKPLGKRSVQKTNSERILPKEEKKNHTEEKRNRKKVQEVLCNKTIKESTCSKQNAERKTDAGKLNYVSPAKKMNLAVLPMTAPGKAEYSFGSMPSMDILRAMGHAKTDQSIRWVTRQPDGLYLQSAYGMLRISPVDSKIIRFSFCRGSQMADYIHPAVTYTEAYRGWMYRASQRLVEMKTEDIYLQIDKSSGAVTYMTYQKKVLLTERAKESRLMETTAQGISRGRLYLEWPKNENLYGMGAGTKAELSLKGVARYISHVGKPEKLPMVISEKGYALVLANPGSVFCCNVSSYGIHICEEYTSVLDYYFMIGKDKEELIAAYHQLIGKRS